MDKSNPYFEQVRLLIRLIPFIDEQPDFSLKGGTAINLFLRDFPRFSVDIDLVYTPISTRDEALPRIHALLEQIASDVESSLARTRVHRTFLNKPDALRLIVDSQGVRVKVELSSVMRGTVFPSERRSVVASVEDSFGYAEMRVASAEDVYAGKLCAALDRQHPRDLFDVWLLFEGSGITPQLRRSLIAYLICHPRPIEELLRPHTKDVRALYEGEFKGMTSLEFGLEDLEETRSMLFSLIPSIFEANEKEFLRSLYSESPMWSLIALDELEHLPAVKWKIMNIAKMTDEKRTKALRTIEEILD